MSLHSPIEWTEATWNPTLGCSKISPGCKGCYAILDVHRMAGNPNPKMKAANKLLTIVENGHPNWTGKVRFIPDRLDMPLHIRKPTKFFVNSLSDLFHREISDQNILDIFSVMYRADWHTFQILTKHGEAKDRLVTMTQEIVRQLGPMPRHIWIGVSVEDKKRLHRIELLRRAPVSVRFLSIEPLLEDLGDISELLMNRCSECGCLYKRGWRDCPYPEICDGRPTGGIDWAIVGGESGRCARPMHPDWARSLQEQCAAAGVAFLFKQWGAWAPRSTGLIDRGPMTRLTRHGRNGHNLANAEDGGDVWMQRVGKQHSGRVLDGRTYDEMPEIHP